MTIETHINIWLPWSQKKVHLEYIGVRAKKEHDQRPIIKMRIATCGEHHLPAKKIKTPLLEKKEKHPGPKPNAMHQTNKQTHTTIFIPVMLRYQWEIIAHIYSWELKNIQTNIDSRFQDWNIIYVSKRNRNIKRNMVE